MLQVVAFIKGTRSQPQCGFSYKVLTLLNEARADYEVVDVLDEQHNPGVREAIKNFSQWPTIPQVLFCPCIGPRPTLHGVQPLSVPAPVLICLQVVTDLKQTPHDFATELHLIAGL